MDILLLIARLALAIVFVVAGLAKLADREGSRQALRDFGLPERLAAPLDLLLPLAELAAGIALIPLAIAWWGALSALALLLVFLGGIAFNLAKGRTPDCHCFGQLHSKPIGWPTLARNGVLTLLTALILWKGRTDPGASVFAWMAQLTPAQTAALLIGVLFLGLLLAQGWFLLNLMRQNGRLLLRIEALEARQGGEVVQAAVKPPEPVAARLPAGLPVGTSAPLFELPLLSGGRRSLKELCARGKSVLLLFSDPKCGPCSALLPDIARWQKEYASVLTVALVSRGTEEDNRAKVDSYGLTDVLLQQDREIAMAFGSHGTPGAVVIRADGIIGSPLAMGAPEIQALVEKTTGKPEARPAAPRNGQPNDQTHLAPPPALKVGDPAPALNLPDLDGKPGALKDFLGQPTLVLFWNPGCGFCRRMLDDLRSWEARPPRDAPKLLVISTGDMEANRAMELRSPIFLSPDFTLGAAFGVRGTPSAVLIDAAGKIASEVAVGAPGVLALAGIAVQPPKPSEAIAAALG